jgi:hypothetical protein
MLATGIATTRRALVLFRIFEHGAMRRPLSSKAQSKPKPAKSEKVPELQTNFALPLHDLELCSGAPRDFAGSNADEGPLKWKRYPTHGRARCLAANSATQTAPFLDKIPFSWWRNVRRFAYPDTSGSERPCSDRGRLARIFWFRNAIRASGTPRGPGGCITITPWCRNMMHRPELSLSYRKASGEVACVKSVVQQRLRR